MAGLVSILDEMEYGVFSDPAGRESAYGLAILCVVVSLGALVLAGRYPSSSLPYPYAGMIGLGYGGIARLIPAAASDLFSRPAFSTIFGTVYLAMCPGIASGAWAAGRILDGTESYALALWIGFLMAILSLALLWLVAPRRPNPSPHPPGAAEASSGQREPMSQQP